MFIARKIGRSKYTSIPCPLFCRDSIQISTNLRSARRRGVYKIHVYNRLSVEQVCQGSDSGRANRLRCVAIH